MTTSLDHYHHPIAKYKLKPAHSITRKEGRISTFTIDHESCQIPWKNQRDRVQVYFSKQRSEEEMQLLSEDMCATLSYWLKRGEQLKSNN